MVKFREGGPNWYGSPVTRFSPRLDILPPPQRRLWDELGAVPERFTLYGGTALALHLGHRQSVDFDFFGADSFDALDLVDEIKLLSGAKVIQTAPSTLTCAVERGGRVLLSFFGVPRLAKIAPPAVARDIGLSIASLADLAGTKIAVLQLRSEMKDYLDIHGLIESGAFTLSDILTCGKAVHGDAFNAHNALKAATYFDDGGVRHLPADIKSGLRRAALAVDLDRLPPVSAILAK